MNAAPQWGFSEFFLDDQTLVPDVFSIQCLFIPHMHFETSLVMISYYGYEWSHSLLLRDITSQVAGGRTIFGRKCMFFQLLSTIKVKLVDKMKQSTYLCVILHVKTPKNYMQFLPLFIWFLTLGKIQNGGQDHLWNIPHLVKRFKGFPLKVECFRKTLPHIKYSRRGSINPFLVPQWGYDFACTAESWTFW